MKKQVKPVNNPGNITPAMAYISLLNAQILQSKGAKKDALIRVREKHIKLYNMPKPGKKGGTNDE